MTSKEALILKSNVHKICVDTIQTQLDTIESSLDQLMEAKTNETKSSAGDKYETGMAMIQNQERLYKRQQLDAMDRLNQMRLIHPETKKTVIEKGSLVELSTGLFYLSVAIGKVETKHKSVFALSLESPLGVLLRGKKIGDSVILNGKSLKIITVN